MIYKLVDNIMDYIDVLFIIVLYDIITSVLKNVFDEIRSRNNKD